MSVDIRTRPLLAAAGLCAALLALALPERAAGQAPAPTRKPTVVPTPVPTPVPPERLGPVRKGAAPVAGAQRYENPNVRFSKLTRVEEVDLDNDGVFE